MTYGTKNIQLLTASVITSGSAVKVKIHTTAPLCAPHTTKLKIPSTVATLHPTSTYGLPVNAAGDSAELLQNAAGFYETHLYFKSSGKDKINTFLQAGEPPGEKTLFPKANVATKVAEHEFRPHVQLKDIPEYAASTELRVYAASINNFLAETINFFIEPDGEVGKYYDYKMPIMASSVQTSNFDVVSGTTYFMSVNLYMGQSHVMCEGPRFANLPYAGTWASSSMRGAFFGPPMEVVHRDASLNGPAVLGYTKESDALSLNLTDPAYHHVTPPYFYGPSSVLIKYQATGSKVSMEEIYSAAKESSLYFEEYVTGMGFTPTQQQLFGVESDAVFPTSSLSPKLPTKKSVSTGSAARMKLEQSVDIWKDGFSLVDIVPLGGLGAQSTGKAWVMAPKWVCPVLDFGLPTTIVRTASFYDEDDKKILSNREESIKTTTPYYNYCTGRSMWLGYGVDPYDQDDLSVLKEHLEEQKSRIDEINSYFTQLEISDMEGDPAAYIVDPAQGPESAVLGKKGIYLQISETFPEAFSGQISSSITFETPFSGSGEASGYYTNRNEVFKDAATGSLVDLLGFGDSTGTEPHPVGKISSSKKITEAVVAIPYFEEPFSIVCRQDLGPDSDGIADRDLLSTTSIIPGYHFLKIDEVFFENALSVMLVDHLTSPTSKANTVLKKGTVFQNFEASKSSVKRSDVGNMIMSLLGQNSDAKLGYMIPPELDFIHNSGVDAFQMAIVPFSHELDKTDLMNIWQNLAPDPARKASKVDADFVFNPSRLVVNVDTVSDLLGPDIGMTHPLVAGRQGQFLCPTAITTAFNANAHSAIRKYGHPPKNAAEFYEKLRWLVFKVKQRSALDYDMYKKRQVDLALERQGIQRHQDLPKEYTALDSLSTRELYGSNWPYDFFSLIERAKIEIEYMVPGGAG